MPFKESMADYEIETSSIDSMTDSGRNRDRGDESIAQIETHAYSLGSTQCPSTMVSDADLSRDSSDLLKTSELVPSGMNEDFNPLEQENESVFDQIINKNTGQSQMRMREETFLGDKAIIKVKHKQPGKDEPLQINIDKVCVIAEHGQEPELVPKSMPGPDQEPFRDIKSERGPGQKRDRET